MSWLRNRRAPSTGASYNTGASLQRSRPVPRPVILDVLTLLSWCCRRSRGSSCFLAGGVQQSVHSGFQYCTSILGSPLRVFALVTRPRARAAGGFLYPGAILKALSAGVSPAVRSTTLLADRYLLKFLPQGGPSPLENHALLH